MDQVLTNHGLRGKRATRKQKPINIILGPHRLRGCSIMEALAMVHTGGGYIRKGNDLTLIYSEAWGQAVRS